MLRLTTATHSSRCLETFHCSSAVAGGQLQREQTNATRLMRSSSQKERYLNGMHSVKL